jgi:transcriptional regulator with XRE-family HTH domain
VACQVVGRDHNLSWSVGRVSLGHKCAEEVVPVPAAAGRTVRRRRLGFELRRLREAAGLKLDQVAGRLDLALSTLSRIETGKAPCRSTYAAAMLEIYGVTDPAQREMLIDMARQGQRRDWWDQYGNVLPTGFGTYVGLEAEAATLRVFEAQLVHGLLQTADYARALLRAGDRKASAEHIDRFTELRMKRQEVLERADDPLELWVILDEAVLRRPVGGRKVMRAQLGRLAEASELPNVTLQVLPFSQGAHPALDGPFGILEFPGGGPGLMDPGVVYIESPAGNIYLEKDRQVRLWAEVFDQLRAQALSPDESREFINTVGTEE